MISTTIPQVINNGLNQREAIKKLQTCRIPELLQGLLSLTTVYDLNINAEFSASRHK